MAKVFVSYSRDDRAEVAALEHQLAGPRVALWRDQEKIYGGDRWPKVLGEAIAASDLVLLIWSKHAAASHFVEFEWCTALALKTRVIPWLLDATPLPPSLSASSGFDARAGERSVAQLLKSLRGRARASRPAQQRDVIAELELIAVQEPKAVVKAARAAFEQHNWVVYGDVYQAGRDLHVTIQAPKKPRRIKPSITAIDPASAASGATVAIAGANFGAFEIGKSRLMIGPRAAEVVNWSSTRIEIVVPEQLQPGAYPVSVQIDDTQGSSAMPLQVTLFPAETIAALTRGERFLLLVAQVEGDGAEQLLQADMLEQIRLAVDDKPELRDKLLVAPWPATFAGPNALRLAQQAGDHAGARLVLFGRLGEARTFYPRLAVTRVGARSFARPEERLASVTEQERLVRQEQHTLSAEPIDRPVRLMHFIIGWYQHEQGDYAAARSNFLQVLEGAVISSIDVASFRLKAGDACLMLGQTILERPYREDKDRRDGEELLLEGLGHLEQAARAYAEQKNRNDEAARVYIKVALAVSSMPSRALGDKHQKAIENYQQALQLLDCAQDVDGCILAYGNLSASQEWYASTQWNRKAADDLLEASLRNGERTLELVEVKAQRLKKQSEEPDAAEQRIVDFERVWFKNGIAVTVGHLYRGDRDANLEAALGMSHESLTEFEKQPDEMRGRIALTWNHIGRCYINLARGDRAANLGRAREALNRGLTYVGARQFPEFQQTLEHNLQLLAEVERRGGDLPDYEIAGRLEAEFEKLETAGDKVAAERSAFEYLNWSWRHHKDISMHGARAHYQLGRVAEGAGNQSLAAAHLQSARVILSAAARLGESDYAFLQFLEGRLRALWAQQGLDLNGVDQRLADVGSGYRIYRLFQQEGDRSAEQHPAAARKHYDRALDFYPFQPRLLVNRSVVRKSLNDLDGYVADLSTALLIDPSDPIARFNRSTIYMAGERWQDAAKDLEVAIEADPSQVNFRLAHAKCLEALGRGMQAAHDYQVALENITDPNVRAQVREKLKKTTSSIEP